MKRISSRKTFFVKRILPVFWLGAISLFIVSFLFSFQRGKVSMDEIFGLLAMPVVMLVMGVFMFRKFYWPLADEVQDGGHFLLVRKSGVEERILLSEVINLSMATYSNPQSLTLRLRKPWKFGDEVAFIPVKKWSFDPFSRNEVAEDLIRRCDAARRAAA